MTVLKDEVAPLLMPPMKPGAGGMMGIGGMPNFLEEGKGAKAAADYLNTAEGKILAQHITNQLKANGHEGPVTQSDLITVLKTEQERQVGGVKKDIDMADVKRMVEDYNKAMQAASPAGAALAAQTNGVTLVQAVTTYGGVSQSIQNKTKELGL
jgi:hypothetical protein